MLPSSLACERLTIVLEYPFFENLKFDEDKGVSFHMAPTGACIPTCGEGMTSPGDRNSDALGDAFRALQSASRTRPSNNAQVLTRMGV